METVSGVRVPVNGRPLEYILLYLWGRTGMPQLEWTALAQEMEDPQGAQWSVKEKLERVRVGGDSTRTVEVMLCPEEWRFMLRVCGRIADISAPGSTSENAMRLALADLRSVELAVLVLEADTN